MSIFGGRPPREPSAVELARQNDTCVACERTSTRKEPTHIPGHGLVPMCADVRDCLSHARKVGIYCA